MAPPLADNHTMVHVPGEGISIFSLIFDPIDPLFHLFDPSFLQNLRSDWVQFFYHVLNPVLENLMKYPPTRTHGPLWSVATIYVSLSI